jgi:hypothetical protein
MLTLTEVVSGSSIPNSGSVSFGVLPYYSGDDSGVSGSVFPGFNTILFSIANAGTGTLLINYISINTASNSAHTTFLSGSNPPGETWTPYLNITGSNISLTAGESMSLSITATWTTESKAVSPPFPASSSLVDGFLVIGNNATGTINNGGFSGSFSPQYDYEATITYAMDDVPDN